MLPSLLLPLLLPLLLSVSGSSPNPKPTTLPPSESETLFTIMDSMSSDKSWRLAYPNPCKTAASWIGIECKPGKDNFLHVSRLDFGRSPYPTCKRTSKFPYLVFSLPYLESLFFFNCFTVSKTSLSMSSFRLMNSSLQQLSLRSNPALIGPIPPQIASLKSLKILTLSQNRLTGPIPFSLFSMTSLVHIDLSYNMLSGSIPHQVGSLKALVGLDLSYNSLSGFIPEEIGKLGLLQKIDLSSNLLFGGIPDSIEKLKSLAFMALSNNKLRGDIPKGLAKLQNLQYFIMDDNPMHTTLPLELGMLVKLVELRLANSGYSGQIPENLSKLSNLSTLSLENNRLTGEIPAGFGTLPHIYHFNLSRNLLVGVVPFDTSFYKRLGRSLDLSGNPGLCLRPGEASSVTIGVDTCGKTGSSLHSLKSQAFSIGPSSSFFLALMFALTFCCLDLDIFNWVISSSTIL